MDANMEQNSVTLSLCDAVRIIDAAKKMGCTVESLLREAESEERLLYVALKPFSATLRAPHSHPDPQNSRLITGAGCIVAMSSHYAELLVTHGSAEITGYQASFIKGDILDWHKWVLDVPQTVNVDMVFVPRLQLPVMPANATAAKVEDAKPANWILLAQSEAALIWRKSLQLNCSPTKNNIKDDLAKRCREKEIKTDRGIYPAADYLYRHVLRKWRPPTD